MTLSGLTIHVGNLYYSNNQNDLEIVHLFWTPETQLTPGDLVDAELRQLWALMVISEAIEYNMQGMSNSLQ